MRSSHQSAFGRNSRSHQPNLDTALEGCVVATDGAETGIMRARSVLAASRNGVYVAPLVSAAMLSSMISAPAVSADAPATPIAQPKADANGPVVTIMKPGYNDQLQGSAQILIAVEQRRYTPQSVEFFVDDRSATNGGAIPLTSLPSAAFNWPTDKYTDGPHKLTVRVTDTQGFIGQSEVTVYINNKKVVDNAAPVLAWLNPKPGEVLRGEVFIQVQAVDNFGVKYIIVSMNPADNPGQKPPIRSWFLNEPPYTLKLSTSLVPDGMYVLKGQAWDALENLGEAQSILIGIANRTINPTWAPELKSRSNATANTGKTTQGSTLQAPSGPETGTTQGAPTVKATGPATQAVTPPTGQQTPTSQVPTTPSNVTESTGSLNGQNLAVLPSFTHPQRRPAMSLASAAKLPNGTIQGAIPASRAASRLSAYNNAGNGSKAQVLQCASLPPMNPAKFTAAVKTGSNSARALPQPGYPVIPSPLLTMGNGTTQQPSGAIAVPRTSQGLNAVAVIGNQHKPWRASVGNVPTRAGANQGGSRMAATQGTGSPQLTIPPASVVSQGSAAGHSTVSPSLDPRSTAGSRMANRMTPPNAGPRPMANGGAISAQSGSGNLTKMPMTNESRMVKVGPPGGTLPKAGSTPRPSSPGSRVAVFPNLTTRSRSHHPADITVAPASDWIVPTNLPATYVSQRNETLSVIAARYKLPVAVLAATNNMAASARLSAGTKVLMPRPLRVTYKGKAVTGDVASMMVGSTGVTPFRFLFEQQGGKLIWDEKNRRVVARNSTHEVTLAIGSNTATVNRKEVMMDLAAFLLSGRTMVPVRFFEKALQAHVEWEPGTGRLYVAMAHDVQQ